MSVLLMNSCALIATFFIFGTTLLQYHWRSKGCVLSEGNFTRILESRQCVWRLFYCLLRLVYV
ncbi:hypothetical protein XF_0027 [Xylella fastidiosa 9a5c]|uniref:Uncharacterized protein n=1 Tax=Xylella fastidiosa (strain 9a5c) TaxID=160492 RepID=Q9PHB7_XYLFA|nr:hypothetical protein XF_0027 [Xylella fastidiosa 9a5c]